MSYDKKLEKIKKVADLAETLVKEDEELSVTAFNTSDDADGFHIQLVLQHRRASERIL